MTALDDETAIEDEELDAAPPSVSHALNQSVSALPDLTRSGLLSESVLLRKLGIYDTPKHPYPAADPAEAAHVNRILGSVINPQDPRRQALRELAAEKLAAEPERLAGDIVYGRYNASNGSSSYTGYFFSPRMAEGFEIWGLDIKARAKLIEEKMPPTGSNQDELISHLANGRDEKAKGSIASTLDAETIKTINVFRSRMRAYLPPNTPPGGLSRALGFRSANGFTSIFSENSTLNPRKFGGLSLEAFTRLSNHMRRAWKYSDQTIEDFKATFVEFRDFMRMAPLDFDKEKDAAPARG